MGATTVYGVHLFAKLVSIHAPVWVRRGLFRFGGGFDKFQFTHPCGCDKNCVGRSSVLTRFNSRTRVGATAWDGTNLCGSPVSIHAPVWVRLARTDYGVTFTPVSIHAPVWVRRERKLKAPLCGVFQFTHPCGCDSRVFGGKTVKSGFNSRTRVGATSYDVFMDDGNEVSIHAPVWVRHGMVRLDTKLQGFNSRTRVGATPKQHYIMNTQIVSIHAPVWVRLPVFKGIDCPFWFQFTHPCGCDPEQKTF